MAQRIQILKPDGAYSLREQILRDGMLPPDIVPVPRTIPQRRRVLVTGATGFLGRYLLAALLERTDWDLVCLVRASDDDGARRRLNAALAQTGRDLAGTAARVSVVCGDVALPNFGLSQVRYEWLAADIHVLVHAAAEVNWVKSYGALRRSNVLGTLHAIQFACHGYVKPLYFVSTLAVCYAQDGPEHITESTDMAAHIETMPLGYAQSKCVSEVLLHQATARGLPVTVIRPSLICGDSQTGVSYEKDLISHLIRGCIAIGHAADVDWQLDCCPVDQVAAIIVSLMQDNRGGHRVLHLHHPNPRHWRELVLWLNLFGYRVALTDFDHWLKLLDTTARARCRELFALRPFFRGRPGILKGRRIPELYLEGTRSRIDSDRSHDLIAARGLGLQAMDAALLGKYFRKFLDSGFIPAVAEPMLGIAPAFALTPGHLERLLQRHWGDPGLRVLEQHPVRVGTNSIINELSSARAGREVGIWRHRIRYRCTGQAAEDLDLLVKIKADHKTYERIAETIGALNGDALPEVTHLLPRVLGITGAHRRELALYEGGDTRLIPYMPKVFGTYADPAAGVWLLVMEYLTDVEMLDSLEAGVEWTDTHIRSAIAGLGAIHAAWYRREAELERQPWLAPALSVREVRAMAPLWTALMHAAAAHFTQAWDSASLPLQQRLVEEMPTWWEELNRLPRTLIHNDFNPRNLAFRRTAGGLQLCAYDWELAALGVQQHDLAELLCFVLPGAADERRVRRYLELHRLDLQRHYGGEVGACDWEHGFRLSLRNLLVNRFPLYTLIHKFKPQLFLPRILRNWYRLHAWFDRD